jgi:SAM-dependent methyltransferase
MERAQQGQVSRSAADIYEEFFVPALFRRPAEHVVGCAAVRRGQQVIDVACGTGVLARQVVPLVGAAGKVVGLDRNEGMLVVARRLAPGVDWRLGLAEALPFADRRFDHVFCQFGLMFFDDRAAALREMHRVARPGGQVRVAVWDVLGRSPGYAAMVTLLDRLFGSRVADALRAPFALGDPDALYDTVSNAGLEGADLETFDVMARFPSLEAWVRTDIKGWTLADMIDDDQYRLLLAEAREALAGFELGDGSVAFSAPARLLTIAA